VILGLWSCAASAADAPPEAGPPAPATPEPLSAAAPAEYGPQAVSTACPSEFNQHSGWLGWWQNGLKPCLQYSHWGYCDQFEEIPLGARLRAHQNAQVCSGWAARLWLYQYDFCDGGTTLNAAGHRRLTELAGNYPVWSHHVLVIEATPGNPRLDEERRVQVARLLEAAGTPAPVVVGVLRVSAPFGDETREWNTKFMRQTRSGGAMGGGAGGAAGGAGGGAQTQAQ
jgi:hypothetical protein